MHYPAESLAQDTYLANRYAWGVHPIVEMELASTITVSAMKITEAIAAEHEILLSRFAEVERVLPRLKSRAEVGAIAAMVEGLLVDHADLETDLAFVPVDRALCDDGRLTRLAQAHQEIDDRLRRVRRAATCDEARRLFLAALAASREHFQDEERSLFPLMERALKARALIALGKSFQESRRVAAQPLERAVRPVR